MQIAGLRPEDSQNTILKFYNADTLMRKQLIIDVSSLKKDLHAKKFSNHLTKMS